MSAVFRVCHRSRSIVEKGCGAHHRLELEKLLEPAGASDTGVMSLAVRKDAATNLVSADGDYTPLQVDGTGALPKLPFFVAAGKGCSDGEPSIGPFC